MCREVSWTQRFRGLSPDAVFGGKQIVVGIEELGIRMMTGKPAYDNGRYFVVETVAEGLEWTIVSDEHVPMQVVQLDKYEAIRIADEFADSEERAACLP